MSQSANITKDDIESVGYNLYKVIKEHGSSDSNEVNITFRYCSCVKCVEGKYRSFCKNQATVFNF